MLQFKTIWLIAIACGIAWNLLCRPLQAGSTADTLNEMLQEFAVEDENTAALRNFFLQVEKENHGALELLYERLREGLMKNADMQAITEVLNKRLQAWTEAQAILAGQLPGHRRETYNAILERPLLYALESGMPSELFREFMVEPGGRQQRQIQAIIEAAERLFLADIEIDSIRQFMFECQNQQLRRMETFRAADFWIGRKKAGVDEATVIDQLRQMLESKPASDPVPRRRRRHRQNQHR